MNYFNPRRQSSLIHKMARRLRAPGPKKESACLYQEMEVGAVTGFFACTALTFIFSSGPASGALVLFFSFLGMFLGAVIGAVLWIGSAPLPEEPILAPAPGQARSEERRRP